MWFLMTLSDLKPWSQRWTDLTQLNSTGWVESDLALWSQPATHLNSTDPVVASSVILKFGCVSSWVELSPVRRCDQGLEIPNLFRLTENWTISVELSSPDAMWSLFKTQLNSTASWVELSPVRRCDQGFKWLREICNDAKRRAVSLQRQLSYLF